MQGPSHLMLSWYFAEAADVATARDRRIVAWSGLVPDVDVLAYAGAIVYYGFDKDLAYENVWQVIHHRYTHGAFFAIAIGVAAYFLASRDGGARGRARVALLATAIALLHCFLDLAGGGPTWPIYPYWPLSDAAWHAPWSWTIGEWPNLAVLFACLAGAFAYARFVGRSPVECFGDRADAWFVAIVRQGSDARARGAAPARDARAVLRRRLMIWGAVAAGAIAVLLPLGFNPFR